MSYFPGLCGTVFRADGWSRKPMRKRRGRTSRLCAAIMLNRNLPLEKGHDVVLTVPHVLQAQRYKQQALTAHHAAFSQYLERLCRAGQVHANQNVCLAGTQSASASSLPSVSRSRMWSWWARLELELTFCLEAKRHVAQTRSNLRLSLWTNSFDGPEGRKVDRGEGQGVLWP